MPEPYRPPALLLGSLALHAAGAVALAAAPATGGRWPASSSPTT